MLALDLFQYPAKAIAAFYALTNSYVLAISLMALLVMLITAPLVLKQTKGMLEMQKLAPEMRKLQQQHRGDRQKLNEEMMKLYQAHKVNPLASCLPLLLQFPVFIIMFQVLHGLTAKGDIPQPDGSVARGFVPKYISHSSDLFQSLYGKTEMLSWGLDLSKRPSEIIQTSFGKGLLYALLVVALGCLYFLQQRMIASRAAAAPTMSAAQQKIMQYLPVVFAVFLVFYLTGLVVYYMAQAIFRIGLNYYITHRFYRGEHSLGQQAQRASHEARELAAKDGGGGLFAQAKRDLAAARDQPAGRGRKDSPAVGAPGNKRTTPPKNRPTPSGRPPASGRAGRPGGPSRHPKKK